MLRCPAEILDLLVEHGLQSCTSEGLERFDYHDLANIALYSGSRRTVPETAERFLLRFAEGPPAQWTTPRNWEVSWSLRCASPGCSDGTWVVTLPDRRLPGEPHRVASGDAMRLERIRKQGPAVDLRFSAQVVGSRQVVVAPLIRDLFAELVEELRSGRFRYQWMPTRMRTDAAAAVANGTLDCAAASLLLASRCELAGFKARTRAGVVLGLLGVEHVVAEVLDDDGAWKTLDPVFAHLAGRSERIAEEFADFCAGSAGNRMLRWPLPATTPLASHVCDGGSGRYVSEFSASVGAGALTRRGSTHTEENA